MNSQRGELKAKNNSPKAASVHVILPRQSDGPSVLIPDATGITQRAWYHIRREPRQAARVSGGGNGRRARLIGGEGSNSAALPRGGHHHTLLLYHQQVLARCDNLFSHKAGKLETLDDVWHSHIQSIDS